MRVGGAVDAGEYLLRAARLPSFDEYLRRAVHQDGDGVSGQE